MNKTKIEWTDYSINPVSGLCPVACPYCYARRLYKRFKWNPETKWVPQAWDLIDTIHNPSKIFVGSTYELFLNSLPQNWMEYNLRSAQKYPQHTFIFLTKQPHNLKQWSPFPDNCWIGVSTTGMDSRSGLEDIFATIQAKIKFVSIEPLLDYSPMDFRWINWVIVGRQTPISSKTQPAIQSVKRLIEDIDREKVPVFLKNNLKSLLPATYPFVTNPLKNNEFNIIQEFPNV